MLSTEKGAISPGTRLNAILIAGHCLCIIYTRTDTHTRTHTRTHTHTHTHGKPQRARNTVFQWKIPAESEVTAASRLSRAAEDGVLVAASPLQPAGSGRKGSIASVSWTQDSSRKELEDSSAWARGHPGRWRVPQTWEAPGARWNWVRWED